MPGLCRPDEIAFDVSLDSVIKTLGYRKGRSLPTSEILKRIQKLTQQARQLIRPAAIYTKSIFRQDDKNSFYLGDTNFVAPRVASVFTIWGRFTLLQV